MIINVAHWGSLEELKRWIPKGISGHLIEGNINNILDIRESDDSSFKNELPKRHNSKTSEFKIHFYVKRIPTVGMKEDEFL